MPPCPLCIDVELVSSKLHKPVAQVGYIQYMRSRDWALSTVTVRAEGSGYARLGLSRVDPLSRHGYGGVWGTSFQRFPCLSEAHAPRGARHLLFLVLPFSLMHPPLSVRLRLKLTRKSQQI